MILDFIKKKKGKVEEMKEEMDFLRNDDFVYSYWKYERAEKDKETGKEIGKVPIHFAWIVRRKGEIFLYCVLNMCVLFSRHFLLEHENQIKPATLMLEMMGFMENPCHCERRNFSISTKSEFEFHFAIYESNAKQLKEREK